MSAIPSFLSQKVSWKHFGILFLLSALLFGWVHMQQGKKSSIGYLTQKIQETVFNQQREQRELYSELKSLLIENRNTEPGQSLHALLEHKATDHSVYLFQNDSIVFWSDNTIPLDVDTFMKEDSTTVALLENGYYLFLRWELDEQTLFIVSLIKHQYPYQNSFLKNSFSPAYALTTAPEFHLDSVSAAIPIYGKQGQTLFYLDAHSESERTVNQHLVLFLILIIVQLFLLLSLADVHRRMHEFVRNPFLQFLFFTIDVSLIRLAQYYFEIPKVLYDSILFSPDLYSYGLLLPSLGDLVLNVLSFVFIAVYYHKVYINSEVRLLNKHRLPTLVVLLFAWLLLVAFYMHIVESLFFHSAIPLSFSELYQLNALSYLSFTTLAALTIALYVFTDAVFKQIFSLKLPLWQLISVFLVFLGFVGWLSAPYISPNFFILFLPSAYFIFAFFMAKHPLKSFAFRQTLLAIIIFSTFLTLVFYQLNQRKIERELQLISMQLSIESDPLFEFLYEPAAENILSDSMLHEKLRQYYFYGEYTENAISNYLKENHFRGYLEKFDVHFTLCDADEYLNIQPENLIVHCFGYFDAFIENEGKTTEVGGLYRIQDHMQGTYYLSRLRFPFQRENGQTDSLLVYFEFYDKFIPEGLGYPELLVDERRGFAYDLSRYSFSRYTDGSLVYKFGNYLYPTRLSALDLKPDLLTAKNNFYHYMTSIGDNQHILVSTKHKTLIDVLSPFVYFFIFLSVMAFVLLYPIFYGLRFPAGKTTFGFRLQMMIAASLLFSFIVIGISSVFYIRNIYNQKNNAILMEKTQSIMNELGHQLHDDDILRRDMQDYLYQLLVKTSLVFYSDINMYDLDGSLLASSRPEIFQSGLVSQWMHPRAYHKLHTQGEMFHLQKENIGQGSYMSSYIPFSDAYGRTVAYINLPFFARESEVRDEESSFLLTYINIFFLLTGLSIVTALLFSRKLTQPLGMIREKMKHVKFDKPNEKIAWKGKDEIGQLIGQYNHMIDELAHSAELLARSERETAWREMARQVAHEIKNPLTPMRLSVQHLLRAWQEDDPEMENKLKRISHTLIEQIDNLSEIASAFSDFAKMPQSKPEVLDLADVIQNTIGLYSGMRHIRFDFTNHVESTALFFADQKNLSRALNNLIKNAIQAIDKRKNGTIQIGLSESADKYKITISDNGKGMTTEQSSKIFTPYFTTKSSGMGIGLSIVYNIITAAGGSISFDTLEGEGTTFTLLLPRNGEGGDMSAETTKTP